MCGINFWKGNETLRSVYKNRFFIEQFLPFDLLSSQKGSLSLLRDDIFFSLNRSNGVSKNSSFHTDFKNVHITLVKSAPKNSFSPKTL